MKLNNIRQYCKTDLPIPQWLKENVLRNAKAVPHEIPTFEEFILKLSSTTEFPSSRISINLLTMSKITFKSTIAIAIFLSHINGHAQNKIEIKTTVIAQTPVSYKQEKATFSNFLIFFLSKY